MKVPHVARTVRSLVVGFSLIISGNSWATTIDLRFDSLPSAQGWRYQGHIPETTAFSADGTTLTLDTLDQQDVASTYSLSNIIDPTIPFIVSVRARVRAGDAPGNFPFAFVAFTGGEIFRVSLGVERVQALGRTFALDGTQSHDFRLEAAPGVGSSFFVDGRLVGNFPPHSTSVTRNTILFGDGSAFPDSNGLVEIERYTFVQNADLICPPPRTITGCDLESIGPLGYSPGAVPIAPTQLLAEGGNVSPRCDLASLTYRDSTSGTCPTLVVERTFQLTDTCGNSTSCEQTLRLGRGLDLGPLPDLAVSKATYSAFPMPQGPGAIIRWEVVPVALIGNLGSGLARDVDVSFELTGFGAGGDDRRSGSVRTLAPGEFVFVPAERDSAGRGIFVPPGNYTLSVVVESRSLEKNLSNNGAEKAVALASE